MQTTHHRAKRSRLRKLVTIRWTLPLCVIAPLISGITLTSWIAFRSGQQAVEELIQQINLEVAADIEKQVASYLLEPVMVTAAIEAEIISGNINISDPAELSQDLWQLTRSEHLTQTIYYGNNKGEFIYSQHQDGKGRIDLRDSSTNFQRTPHNTDTQGNITQPFEETDYDLAEYSQYDHRGRKWYTNTTEAQEGTWSNVYPAKGNGQLTITRTTPIFTRDGEIEGVLGTDIYLSELSTFLQNLELGTNNRAFIVNSQGGLIAMSIDQVSEINAAIDSSDPLVQATAQNLLSEVTHFDNIQQEKNFTFDLAGEKRLAHVSRLQVQGIDWFIGITLSQENYMGDIRASTQHTIVLGIVITIVASLLALGAALNIVHPINRLTKAAKDITHNQFNPENLAEVIARPDEFSELATLVNDMATVVMSREQSLAEQVTRLKTEIDHGGMDSSKRQHIEDLVMQAKKLRSADVSE